MGTGKIHIALLGAFRITSATGEDLTPSSLKAQGVVALLADDAGRRRSRRWLEAHLWSGREQKQASGSLRQALLEIRQALGSHSALLQGDRHMVWLHAPLVETNLNDHRAMGREFLEGLDIRDEQFEEWLRERRRALFAHLPSRPLTAQPLRIHCQFHQDELLCGIVADTIGQTLEERVSSWVVDRGGDIDLLCRLQELEGQRVVFVRAVHLPTQTVLYSGYRPVTTQHILSADFIASLTHDVVTRILLRLPKVADLDQKAVLATGFSNIALSRLASFEPSKFLEADQLFAQAYEADPNGVYLAWRAFGKMAQAIEGRVQIAPELIDAAETHLRRATEQAPENASVLALGSLTRAMLFDDIAQAQESAERAHRANTNNPIARQSLAISKGFMADPKQAYEMSLSCQRIVGADGFRHLWDLYHALVCIRAGRFDEAITAAERAREACPSFIAPRRQLIALYAGRGDVDKALHEAGGLAKLEEGFTLDRYFRDETYPVMTLREAGLLHKTRPVLL